MPIQHQELIVRGHERFACRLPAVLLVESPGVVLSAAATDGRDIIAADIVDFSAGGAGLNTSIFVPRGCRLRLQIVPGDQAAAPGAPAPVPVDALDLPVRIQRVAMVSREPMYYLGAAFNDLDAEGRAAVEVVLQRLRAAASSSAAGTGPAQEAPRC